MPWKASSVMEERLRFVGRLLDGEAMTDVCRDFGVSRKTGYKIFDRYKDCDITAFTDRSRRPYRQANQLPAPIEATIVRLKREYPGWGAPKIREKLRRQFTGPICRRSAPCTRCWIATIWSNAGAATGPPRQRRSRGRPTRMRSGASTTKANSCWATGGTGIR
jgi:transposase